MGEKELDVYQGQDWITYRWSVAQVFDTLDQIRELCSLSPTGLSATTPRLKTANITPAIIPSSAPIDKTDGPAPGSATNSAPNSAMEMLSLLMALGDDLSSEVHIVLADLFHLLQPSPALQWKGFEMRLHADMLRQNCMPQEHDSDDITLHLTKSAIDTALALTQRMRVLLKQIDQ